MGAVRAAPPTTLDVSTVQGLDQGTVRPWEARADAVHSRTPPTEVPHETLSFDAVRRTTDAPQRLAHRSHPAGV